MNNIEKINQSKIFDINNVLSNKPYCIYNGFNLDPLWHAEEDVHRILLIEPNHFEEFPLTEKVLQFVIDLATTNITGIQIFIGNFEDLIQAIQVRPINEKVASEIIQSENSNVIIYFKEHPTTQHYKGIEEARDWLFPQVNGYFPSFFGYWKKCERYLK